MRFLENTSPVNFRSPSLFNLSEVRGDVANGSLHLHEKLCVFFFLKTTPPPFFLYQFSLLSAVQFHFCFRPASSIDPVPPSSAETSRSKSPSRLWGGSSGKPQASGPTSTPTPSTGLAPASLSTITSKGERRKTEKNE